MGFVTVLVQHAWAMQPAGSEETDEKKDEQKPTRQTISLSSIRVSVPSSIQSFVKVYNSSYQKNSQARLGVLASDVLLRLENMVFSSVIQDPTRTDNIRHSVARRVENKELAEESKDDNPATSKTKRYCAQARRSLLALSRLKSQSIRERCLELLLEALDINTLASDDAEVANLLLFVNEIAEVLEMAIIQRRRRKRQGKALGDKVYYVVVDDYMEKLILCIALSIQRLEFACEVKAFYIPQEVHSSFEHLVEAQLPCLTSEDPYLQQLISSTSETIKWLTSTRVEAEELMASPVALSLLSQITRMTPPNNILSLADPFFGILADLKEKNEWYLGRKFIRLLATSALMNADACALFITLVKRLDNKRCWQWIYMGLLSLGAIVLTSPYAPVRKLALDQGLLFFLKLKELETENLEEDNFWKTRSAAILVLQEIYVCRRSDPMAIMILESLKEQKQLEEHPFIKKQLNNTVPGETTTHGRLFFLFKYICIALAESYSESQSRYIFLRKYLKTTDRKGISIMKKSSSRFPHKKATPTKKGKTEKLSKPRRFWDEKSNEGGFHHDEHDEGNDEASRFLSDHPYHYNYKDNTTIVTKCKLDEEDVETNNLTRMNHMPVRPSLMSNYTYAITPMDPQLAVTQKPSNGSVNRRKLFSKANRDPGIAVHKRSKETRQTPIFFPQINPE